LLVGGSILDRRDEQAYAAARQGNRESDPASVRSEADAIEKESAYPVERPAAEFEDGRLRASVEVLPHQSGRTVAGQDLSGAREESHDLAAFTHMAAGKAVGWTDKRRGLSADGIHIGDQRPVGADLRGQTQGEGGRRIGGLLAGDQIPDAELDSSILPTRIGRVARDLPSSDSEALPLMAASEVSFTGAPETAPVVPSRGRLKNCTSGLVMSNRRLPSSANEAAKVEPPPEVSRCTAPETCQEPLSMGARNRWRPSTSEPREKYTWRPNHASGN
jgi:hypothetical protein